MNTAISQSDILGPVRVTVRVGGFDIPAHLRPAEIATRRPQDIQNRIRHARYRRKLAMRNLGHKGPFPLDAEGVAK